MSEDLDAYLWGAGILPATSAAIADSTVRAPGKCPRYSDANKLPPCRVRVITAAFSAKIPSGENVAPEGWVPVERVADADSFTRIRHDIESRRSQPYSPRRAHSQPRKDDSPNRLQPDSLSPNEASRL